MNEFIYSFVYLFILAMTVKIYGSIHKFALVQTKTGLITKSDALFLTLTLISV